MTKTLISDPVFSMGFTSTDTWHYFKLPPNAITWKINHPNLKKMAKNLILGPILVHLTQIWTKKHFFAGFTSTSN